MIKFSSISIRTQLIVLALLLILPALAIIVRSGLKERGQHYREATVASQKLVDNISEHLLDLTREAANVSSFISYVPDVQKHDVTNTERLLANIITRYPEYHIILIADATGRIWAASHPPTSESIADRRYFQHAKATGRISSGEFVISRSRNVPTIHLAHPLVERGQFRGVVVIGLNLEVLRPILERARLPVSANYVVTDHQGTIISRGKNIGQVVGKPIQAPDLQRMVRGPDKDSYEFTRGDGERRIVSYQKVRLAGEADPFLYVRGGMSIDDAVANATRNLAFNIAALLPFVLGVFLLALFIGKRSIVDRVVRLQTAVDQVARGELHTRVGNLVDGGELGSLAGSFDVMAQKLAARLAEVQEATEEYRAIIQTTSDGFSISDGEGRLVEVNSAYCTMHGYSRDELLTMKIADVEAAEDPAMVAAHIARITRDGSDSFTSEHRRKDGSTVAVAITTTYLPVHGGRYYGFVRDISEQTRTERQLRASEERFRNIMALSPDIISILNERGELVYNSPAALAIHGYEADDLIGRSTFDLIHPDDQPQVDSAFAALLANPTRTASTQYRYRNKDGSYTWMEATASNQLANPLVLGIIVISRNIAERKELEEKQMEMERKLLHAQKLESLGILAGGIAHDFNNILTGIMGNISLARLTVDPSHESYAILVKAENASQRAAALAKQLLVFTKGGMPIKKVVAVQQVVEECLSLTLSGTSVKGVAEMPHYLHSVEADEGQLSQAVHNIVLNGLHAMPGGGELVVRGENVSLAAENPVGLAAGAYVKLSFTDEGCGIDPADLGRVFDPYFTTKPGGSGLGLASSYAIIDNHGGKILVDSTVGIGTTVTLYLPSLGRTVAVERSVEETLHLSGNGLGAVLVMDDDEMVRDLADITLARAGYTVTGCVNGEQAIALYTAALNAGTPFAVVIMDLTIPGSMGGVEAARKILAIDPAAVLVVSSGYSDDPVMANYGEYGFTAAMEKPYRAEEITRIMARVATRGE